MRVFFLKKNNIFLVMKVPFSCGREDKTQRNKFSKISGYVWMGPVRRQHSTGGLKGCVAVKNLRKENRQERKTFALELDNCVVLWTDKFLWTDGNNRRQYVRIIKF